MKKFYPLIKSCVFLLLIPTLVIAKNAGTTILLEHQNFDVSYSESGVRFSPKSGAIEWRWQLNDITGIGDIQTGNTAPSATGNDVRYRRGNITEQYLFRGTSIEQQFVIHRETDFSDDLVIDGVISAEGQFSKVNGGWTWTKGEAKVFLGDVYVFDANGRQIPASMKVTENSSRIVVPSAALKGAAFPVTIDPQIGPDDFVLANQSIGTRHYQPSLIYNPNNQKYFSSWTNYYAMSGRVEHIFGRIFDLAQIKAKPFKVDQPVDQPDNNSYLSKNISGTTITTVNSSATSPDAAYSGSNYLTVWEDFEGPAYSNRKIKYRLNTNDGPIGDPLQVFKSTTFKTNFGWAAQPAAAGNNQKYLITAASGTAAPNYYVFGKYINNDGKAAGADSLTLFSSATGPFVDTDADALPGGSFFVAAAALNSIHFGIAPANGTMTASSSATGNIGSIAIASGATKTLLVWSELSGSGPTSKYIIKGLWITDTGVASGSPFQIDTPAFNGSGQPAVAYNADTNSWVVVWHSSPLTTPGTMIFGREVWFDNSTNSTQMNEVFPVSKQSRTSVSPAVAYDNQNKEFWIAWSGGGNKDQILAQRWTNSLSDCIISLKQDTIRENNYIKGSFDKTKDILITNLLRAQTAAGDSIYPLDFIPENTETVQTSYSNSSLITTKPAISSLDDFHKSRNKLFYVLNDSVNYEKISTYNLSVYAQSETPGVNGQSSKQVKTVRVIDVNEPFHAVLPASVSFLEDAVNPAIPFTFQSGDNQLERNAVQLTVSATPGMIVSAPTLQTNPSVPGGGHADAIPRTRVLVPEKLLFSLKPNTSGTGDLKFRLTDLKGGDWIALQKNNTADFTVAVTVLPVNDAPTFTRGSDITVNEDAGAQTIANWAKNIDAGAPDESSQTLNFIAANNNNALFSSQPAINTNGALTFTPAPDAFGTATVTVSLKDNGGIDNGGIDQSAAQTFTITVNPVNDAPTFTKGSDLTVNEDAGAQTITNWATSISRGPANENNQILTFTLANDNLDLFDTQPSVSTSGTLTFTPKANAFGVTTITVILSDDGTTAYGGADKVVKTFTITVLPVNDAPVFTKGADQTVPEDAGAQTVTNWATGISAGNSFENSQSVSFVLSNDNNTLFAVQPSLSASGTLSYRPAANAFGSATVSVRLEDNGGTANGGVNSGTTVTFTIQITSVNDAPFFVTGISPTVLEDSGTKTISGWASGIHSGAPNESSQTLIFQVSVANPDLFSVQPAIDAVTGDLSFTPAPDAFGITMINITLFDNGGTASGGINSFTQSTTISVTGVNDKPLFTAGNNQTAMSGSGTRTITRWATNISAGPANEVAQLLNFVVTNNNPTLFVTPPAINAATGTLTFTPKSDAEGSAIVSVRLTDNGGTDNGGIDASGTTDFTITLILRNSAPSFTAGSNITVNEDAAAQAINWATNLSAGTAPESDQTLTFILNNDNPALFSEQPSINSTTGILTFKPAANAHGVANIQVQLKDDGGTTNGGADLSSTSVLTIAVTSVNDAPTFIAGANQTVREGSGAQTVTNWATGISPGDSFESSQSVSFVVSNDNNALFAVQPSVSASGTLSYTPEPNILGSATVSVRLEDNGGTANGGVNTSSTETFTITIFSENNAPSFTAGSNVTVDEDAESQAINWATSISAGPVYESGQLLTFILNNDNPALFSEQPSINSTTGILTFKPAANAHGAANIQVQLKDNGGTANGGADLSSTSVLTITVNSVNDAPIVVNPFPDIQVDEFSAYAFAANASAFTDTDGDPLTVEILSFSGNWIQKKSDTEAQGFPIPDSDNKATITVRATDSQGLWAEDVFELNVVRKPRPLIYGQISGSQPLPDNLQVVLMSVSGNQFDTVAVTRTDSRDYYLFEAVAPQNYIVKAVNHSTSYPQFVSTYYETTADWTRATPIAVSGNTSYRANISMLLNTVTAGNGSVSGFVRVQKTSSPAQAGTVVNGAQGAPLPFADLTLTVKGQTEVLLRTQTATDGSYR
ncbi:MAG: hypothetical protein JNL03_17040, partial [Prolixibacteraceae bacterium]|nr:hypothetical protein [Prolixibacteraceae bacterium]